jgi:hypothetical protein
MRRKPAPLFAPTIDSTPPGNFLCRIVLPLSFGPCLFGVFERRSARDRAVAEHRRDLFFRVALRVVDRRLNTSIGTGPGDVVADRAFIIFV